MKLVIPTILAVLLASRPAAAEPVTYAVVVGSNAPGDGQDALRYAERDAQRMAEVLEELGGYASDHVFLVLAPTPDEVLAAIGEVERRVRADAAAGRQSMVFFYYSGHARSHALTLGDRELALTTLRDRLLGLPSTLTIVVLDACQSGAFSRVKGAEPAADFSFNSVARLDSAGLAVMASSSATELSQESEHLGSSYFTHHLLVALRGAGDSNGDGRVSLDEAYRYAYHHTLATTSATSVGAQHVTLETDLKGKGEVALTYPARADAQLELPAALAGTVLVQRRRGGAVVAEITKAAGAAYRLALPAGAYRATVRADGVARRCELTLDRGGVAALDPAVCAVVPYDDGLAKGPGAGVGALAPTYRWSLEVGVGFGGVREDAFTDRLLDFGFQEDGFRLGAHVSIAGHYRLSRRFGIVADVTTLDGGSYRRDSGVGGQTYSWSSTAFGVFARGTIATRSERALVFAQAGGGLARVADSLEEGDMEPAEDTYWGYHLGFAIGAQLRPWRTGGFFLRLSTVTAPVMDNLIGDTHDSGGVFGTLGILGAF